MNVADNLNNDNVVVHTGFPNPATDDTMPTLNLNDLLVRHPASTFFMRISGHAWEHMGVYDGDVAIIDKALSSQLNDYVVWWNEHFILCRAQKVPAHVRTWGVVTSIVHQYRKSER